MARVPGVSEGDIPGNLDSPLELQENEAARISGHSALWPKYQGYLREISLVFRP